MLLVSPTCRVVLVVDDENQQIALIDAVQQYIMKVVSLVEIEEICIDGEETI